MIAKHKAALLGCMSVKVYVDKEVFMIISIVHYGLFDSPYRRLIEAARIEVISVQVVGHCVKPIVPSRNAIRIKHRNHFEDEIPPQNLPLLIVGTTHQLYFGGIFYLLSDDTESTI